MCGIGGVLWKHRVDESLATRLAPTLTHRGRSGQDGFADRHISLHAARHAVIAIQDAHQPLRDASGELVLVGNGEILNYRELAGRLPEHVRRNLPRGDLQVALELFAADGIAGFEPLRGPFALAVWDARRGELTLARDRLGERALYVYEDDDVVMFASEVRCLVAALDRKPTLDRANLLEWVGLARTSVEQTLYEEITPVAPGAILQITRDGTRRRALAPLAELSRHDSSRPAADEVARLLEQAKQRVLVADCPVAIGFSGGIDSTVVLDAALRGADVAAVLTVFSESAPGLDENLRRARIVAKIRGVDLIEVPFAIPNFDQVVEILDSTLDGPATEPLILHNNALHVAAQEFAPVLLGGHGADEVFGGYARYGALKAMRSRSTTEGWMRESPWERWNRVAGWKAFLDEVAGPALTAVEVTTDPLDRPFPYDFAEYRDPVLFGQAIDMFRLMAHDMYRVGDENGIACGVEVRSPFFDIDLVSGVYNLPVEERIGPTVSKHFLWADYVGTPLAEVFAARKVGFDDGFPYGEWMLANWDRFSATILDGPLRELGIVSDRALADLRNLEWHLQWRLFALTLWLTREERRRWP